MRASRQRPGSIRDDRQRPVQRRPQFTQPDHTVDHPVALQVLRGLDAGRKGLVVQQLVHPRTEKPDQGAWLGHGDVAQRSPRRKDAAGGRIAQVDQVGEMRLPVQLDGRGDLHHLQKRDRALLHAGAAGARRRQQRQPLGSRALHSGGDPFGGGHADRAGEEAEVADHHRDPPSKHAPFARRYRLVAAAGGASVGQFARIASDTGTGTGSISQLTKEPSSSTASRSWSVVIRLTGTRLYILAPMIGITQTEAVMTIELQRPERRNALNSQLVEELREALVKASGGETRAVVLTGQGTAFCAGADLSGDAFAADYPDRLVELHRVMDAVPVPVIGAINGPAIGAGLQLAMQCDLRVVAPDAFFQFPTSKYGLALDNWSIRRLSSLVGHGRARAMLLTAEKLTADVALQTGMANRIGTLEDAQEWAAEISGLAPLAIQHAKRVLNDDGSIEQPWPDAQRALR